MTACSHCAAELPEGAAFCPSCGRRTDAVREEPIDVQHAQPRYFGLGPPVFVLVVAAALLALGVVLLLADAFALGMLCLIVAVALLPTFLAGARRWPESPVARVGVSTADRVRDEADVAVESITTWSRAGRDVVRLRREQYALKRQREAKVRELGVSVYADDGRADELKEAAKELDQRLEANERELQRTIAGARRRVRKGRAAVVSTEVIKPEPEVEQPEAATQTVDSEPLEEGAAPGPDGERRGADPPDDETNVVELDQRP